MSARIGTMTRLSTALSCWLCLRGPRRATFAALLALTACSPLPPHVDTTGYVPLVLAPAALTGVRDERANFRRQFCSEPETGEVVADVDDACSSALRRFRDEGDGTREASAVADLRPRYRIAVALGMGWDCVRELINEEHLPTTRLREYGYSTTLLDVEGLSSSERNAELIAQQLAAEADDDRPLILVGYSKGATDLLVALDLYPELAARTAALVTVAGSIGGSPVIDHTTERTTAVLRYNRYGNCTDGDGGVLDSLRPPRRHGWLYDHLPLPVPSYSLITAPEPDRVSRLLRSSYKLLGAVHPINDGALLHWDQMLPGSTLLGYANADHWAVAVPIESDDIPLGEFLLRNGYPRTRLWLAVADFVIADLQTAITAQLTASGSGPGHGASLDLRTRGQRLGSRNTDSAHSAPVK